MLLIILCAYLIGALLGYWICRSAISVGNGWDDLASRVFFFILSWFGIVFMLLALLHEWIQHKVMHYANKRYQKSHIREIPGWLKWL